MGILDIKESEVEEEEIELTLGLSIGGGSDSFKKFEMKSPMSNKKKKREEEEEEEEEEEGGFEQISKKLRSDEDIEGVNMKNPNLGFPVLPMQLGFQYVPFVDGFGFHYPVIPCWVPPLPTGDRNVIHQPIPLRPFEFENTGLSNQDLEVKNCDSFDLSKSSGLKDTDSSGSGGNSSSADSHYHNGSHLGNETRTESNHSSPPSNQSQLHDLEMMNINVQKKSQQSNPSNQLNPTLNTKETKTSINNLISLSTAESNPTKPEDEPVKTNPLSINKLSLPLPPHKVKEINEECEMKANQIQSLLKMPCVSTTGDGPNGKTISGFLYRYTKAEVSIVCVCHGSSFSPAEFVKHAGGTDVTQPLKHIVVVQSPFS